MIGAVRMQDFDLITENGKHLGPTGEFSPGQFQDMMTAELWRYSRRQLDNVLSVSGDEQFRSTILMLKILETSMHRSFKSLSDQLNSERPAGRVGSPGSVFLGDASAGRFLGIGAKGSNARVDPAEMNAAEVLRVIGGKLESMLKLWQGQAAAVAGLHAAQAQASSSISELTKRFDESFLVSR